MLFNYVFITNRFFMQIQIEFRPFSLFRTRQSHSIFLRTISFFFIVATLLSCEAHRNGGKGLLIGKVGKLYKVQFNVTQTLIITEMQTKPFLLRVGGNAEWLLQGWWISGQIGFKGLKSKFNVFNWDLNDFSCN